jgi:hypothetical protein
VNEYNNEEALYKFSIEIEAGVVCVDEEEINELLLKAADWYAGK